METIRQKLQAVHALEICVAIFTLNTGNTLKLTLRLANPYRNPFTKYITCIEQALAGALRTQAQLVKRLIYLA